MGRVAAGLRQNMHPLVGSGMLFRGTPSKLPQKHVSAGRAKWIFDDLSGRMIERSSSPLVNPGALAGFLQLSVQRPALQPAHGLQQEQPRGQHAGETVQSAGERHHSPIHAFIHSFHNFHVSFDCMSCHLTKGTECALRGSPPPTVASSSFRCNSSVLF